MNIKQLSVTNTGTKSLNVISEVPEFNNVVIPSGAKFTFAANLPDDLKIFHKKIRKGLKAYMWVGIVDKDAPF